jgi:putative transcriptional regulator
VTPRTGGPVRAATSDGAAATLVRSRRKEVGLTQQQLADAVGVSRQTVLSLESGDYAPSVYLALAVARALETSVETHWG